VSSKVGSSAQRGRIVARFEIAVERSAPKRATVLQESEEREGFVFVFAGTVLSSARLRFFWQSGGGCDCANMEHFKSKIVTYFYDEEIGNFCYGGGNPMRPHRVRLTHNLVDNYGLIDKLKVFRPTPQDQDEIAMFHADEYVDFLNAVTPDNQEEYLTQLRRFNLGPAGEADCPVFDGIFEYCQIYSGGSVNGASVLANGDADICLNWSGGMHHAKKAEASGFCYINDIVLGILELLKTHQRVLYVDIDIHHGDGVEEAFYLTDRVMTVSFHKYGDFFPGTGAVGDIGYGPGKYYSLNVPLQEGMDDESYRTMFEPIMQKVMEKFQPGAVVVCGGADSLSGDRLGCFNLSLEGHSNCIEFLGRFNVPMLVLGGGGYTMRNVARCWAYETGRLQGVDLPDKLPQGALANFDYYMDTHNLRIATSNMKNGNSREMMEKIKEECLKNLQELPAAPGAQFHIPPPKHKAPVAPEDNADERGGGQQAKERRVNKFAGNADDDTPEEDANLHRGGRDVTHSAPAAAASTGAELGAKEAVKIDKPPVHYPAAPATHPVPTNTTGRADAKEGPKMDKKLAALPDPSPEGKLPPAVAKGAAGATMPASTAGKPVTASASLGRKPPAQTVQQLSDSKAPAKGPVPPPAVGVPPQSASAPPTSTAGPMAPVHAAKEGVPPGGGAPQQIGSETKAQAPAAAGDASSAVPPSKGQIGAVPAKSAIPPAPVQPAPAASAPTGGVPGPVTGPAGVDSMVVPAQHEAQSLGDNRTDASLCQSRPF